MKKMLVILSLIINVIILSSCDLKKYDIILISNTTIFDKSFNQGTWEGIKKFVEENNEYSANYLQSKTHGEKSYADVIANAVKKGAKVIVAASFYFEKAIYAAQNKYPDIKFIVIDAAPVDENGKEEINKNTLSIVFKEEEAGFLAGYAVVKDKKYKIGYLGGEPQPPVQRFGIGYIAGAYYAAKEDKKDDFKFNVDYYEYLNDFNPSDLHVSKAAIWYKELDVIFAAAGGAGNSVMKAAETSKKHIVGVDVNQKDESSQVITSAMKELSVSINVTLKSLFIDKNFDGGTKKTFSTKEAGIALPDDFSRFEKFNKEDYTAIFNKIKTADVSVPNSSENLISFLKDLNFSNLNETYYNDLKRKIGW